MTRSRGVMVLGSETFATKRAALERIRGVLYGLEFDEPIADGQDFDLLVSLLERHPQATDKIGAGVAAFVVRPNPVYPTNRGFWLLRTDGTTVDWSLMECLHVSSHASDVRQTLRRAVVDQILEFKNVTFDTCPSVPCAVTREPCTRETCHVDHAPPTFLVLAQRFTEAYGGYERILLTPSVDGAIGRELADGDQLRHWQSFHRAHARLRIVTPLVNLSLLRRIGTKMADA